MDDTKKKMYSARDGENWYGYAGQNPVNYTDPEGLFAYGQNGQYSTNSQEQTQSPGSKAPDISAMPGDISQTNSSYSAYSGVPPQYREILTQQTIKNISLENNFGANYDSIMQQLQNEDLSKGLSFEFIFSHTFFNENNPLNQIDLDKALGIQTNSKTTKSCQTTALINAYGLLSKKGVSGQNILNIFPKNEDGSFGSYLNANGSPKQLKGISNDLANELHLDKKIVPADKKMSINILANLSFGAIVGLTKDGVNDQHFVFKNWDITIDSLDPNRTAAKNYTENTYRILALEDNK